MRFVNGLGVILMFNPMNWLSTIVNFFIDVIYMIVQAIVFLLPASPFDFEPLDWGPFGQLVGAFFPIPKMFLHFSVITTAILLYYAVRQLLRLIKMVQ
jgi:hypothetical protein